MRFTKDTLLRTLKTFCQTAIGYIIVGLIAFDYTELEDWRTSVVGLCISGIAAGIAAIMNLKPSNMVKKVSTSDEDDEENLEETEDEEVVG